MKTISYPFLIAYVKDSDAILTGESVPRSNTGTPIFQTHNANAQSQFIFFSCSIDVDEDETITYIHATTSKGPILGYMNLKYPDLARKDGKVINSYLRGGKVPYSLASYCFNSYGTIFEKPN